MVNASTFSRRRLLLRMAAGAGAVAIPGSMATAAHAAGADPTSVLFNRINAYRTQNGRPALPIEHRLTLVAQSWSQQMGQRGRMSHNPDYLGDYGWPVDSGAEIVARAGDADRVVDAWINSPSHRGIMLGNWTDVGIGWAIGADGQMYATADFIRAQLSGVGQEALGLSRAMIVDGSAERVVMVADGNAADGVCAAALVDGNTPLLFGRSNQALPPALSDELRRVAAPGATVSLVGGSFPDAVPGQISALGLRPVILRGATRFETSAVVAREVAAVRGRPWRYFLASGDSWADAVTAGAFAARHGTPILLTPGQSLHSAARSVLDSSDADRVAVGGTAAISDAVTSEAGAWRLTGADRAGTSGRVLNDAWALHAQPGSPVIVTPGWTGDGWATGLAHATYAARHGAPLMYAGDGLPPAVGDALVRAGFGPDAPANLAFARHVPSRARQAFVARTS